MTDPGPAPAPPDGSTDDAAAHPGRVKQAKDLYVKARGKAEEQWDKVEGAREHNRALDTAFSTYEHDLDRGGGLLAGALAYRFFFWTLPFALVVIGLLGFASTTESGAEDMGKRLGVIGLASHTIAQAGTDAAQARWWALLIGIPGLYFTSISFVKALRVAHALVWGVPVPPATRTWRFAVSMNVVLVVLAVIVAAENAARDASSSGGLVITLAFILLIAAAWTAISWYLPHNVASWHELVPGALFVAAGTQVVHLVVVYYISRKLQRASATYGSLGAAAAILLALFFLSRVVIAGAALNEQLNERRRRLHGADVPDEDRLRWRAVLTSDTAGPEPDGPPTTTQEQPGR